MNTHTSIAQQLQGGFNFGEEEGRDYLTLIISLVSLLKKRQMI